MSERVMTDLEWDKAWEQLERTVSFANKAKERIEELELQEGRWRVAANADGKRIEELEAERDAVLAHREVAYERAEKAEAQLDALNCFNGVLLLAETLLTEHYPRDTIVCSTNPRASIGALVTGNLTELVENLKAAGLSFSEMKTKRDAALAVCRAIARIETVAKHSMVIRELIAVQAQANAAIGHD